MVIKELILKRLLDWYTDTKGQIPSPGEYIELLKMIPKIEGRVRVETFDAINGKTVAIETGHNFLSLNCIDYLKQIQKLAMAIQNPNSYIRDLNLNRTDYSSVNLSGAWRWLFISDSAAAESPSTETTIPGEIIGYADKLPYSSTDVLRGAINQNECYADDNSCRFVFDFATDRANGTFQSVGLCKAPVPSPFSTINFPEVNATLVSRSFARSYTCIKYYNGYYWGHLSSVIYKIDPTTLAEITSYTLAYTASDFAISGDYIYHAGSTTYMARYNMNTGATTILYVGSGAMSSFCTDDTYVYAISGFSVIYRISIDTYTRTDYKTPSLPAGYSLSAGALLMHGGNIYVALTKTALPNATLNYSCYVFVKWDYSTNTFDTSDIIPLPNYALVFSSDGTDLYYIQTVTSYYNNTTATKTCLWKYPYTTASFKNLITRKLLATPITKTSSQTMKVTYDLTYE